MKLGVGKQVRIVHDEGIDVATEHQGQIAEVVAVYDHNNRPNSLDVKLGSGEIVNLAYYHVATLPWPGSLADLVGVKKIKTDNGPAYIWYDGPMTYEPHNDKHDEVGVEYPAGEWLVDDIAAEMAAMKKFLKANFGYEVVPYDEYLQDLAGMNGSWSKTDPQQDYQFMVNEDMGIFMNNNLEPLYDGKYETQFGSLGCGIYPIIQP